MITRIGKLLVIFNLILSLLFATVALGIFTNRINWPGTVKGGEEVTFEGSEQKIKQINMLGDLANRGNERWIAARNGLAQSLNQRATEQRWYEDELKKLKEGDGPVKTLVYQNGKLQVEPSGRPSLTDHPLKEKLQPREKLVAALNSTEDQIGKAMDDIDKAIKQEQDLTEEINGKKTVQENKVQIQQRGLRDNLAEYQKIEKDALAELVHLRDVRYNLEAELAILQKRQKALTARINELKASAVTAQKR